MLDNIRIGLGVTGSFCNLSKLQPQIQLLKDEGVKHILPIVSYSILTETNRFGTPENTLEMLKEQTGNDIIDTISKAEPIGPKDLIDVLVIAPCTGNTLAKFALGITDTPVLMALKSHIRNNKPIVFGVSSNDAMGANGQNLFKLLNTKNIYFIPFAQDEPLKKPKSLVYDYTKLVDTVYRAMEGKQIQPVIL